MKSKYVRYGLALLFMFVIVVFAIVFRWEQFNKGTGALKVGNGAVALEVLTPFAELGDSTAQRIIGEIYAYGVGVPKNDEKAIYWFRRASSGTTTETDRAAASAFYVANDYASRSYDEAANRAESMKWLQFAANGGSQKAKDMLSKTNKLSK
jgi:uncharacterized protein